MLTGKYALYLNGFKYYLLIYLNAYKMNSFKTYRHNE